MTLDPLWLCVTEAGHVLRQRTAPDKGTATRLLGPQRGEYVVSAASHALSLPKPLKSGMCRSCGQRSAVMRFGVTTGRCTLCADAHHREQQNARRARQGRTANPLPPAFAASMRAELARQSEGNGTTRGGRPRGPRINLGDDD